MGRSKFSSATIAYLSCGFVKLFQLIPLLVLVWRIRGLWPGFFPALFGADVDAAAVMFGPPQE